MTPPKPAAVDQNVKSEAGAARGVVGVRSLART